MTFVKAIFPSNYTSVSFDSTGGQSASITLSSSLPALCDCGTYSTDMPVWGPMFRIVENYNEADVTHRSENLCKFIESIQEK